MLTNEDWIRANPLIRLETLLNAADATNCFQLVPQFSYKCRESGVKVYKQNNFAYTTIFVEIESTASQQVELITISHLSCIKLSRRMALVMFLIIWLLQDSDLVDILM